MASIAIVISRMNVQLKENQCDMPGSSQAEPMQKLAVISLGIKHFTATIKAGRADMVTQMHFAGGRLDGRRRRGQKVVRTVHATLRGGFFILLNSHNVLQITKSKTVNSKLPGLKGNIAPTSTGNTVIRSSFAH
jgi:hypothetical protein